MSREVGKRFIFTMSRDNYDYLKKVSNLTNTKISRTINDLIVRHREITKDSLTPAKKLSNTRRGECANEIRFIINKEEKDFLEQEAKRHSFNTITQEAKFRLLSTIYDDGIATNAELNALRAPLKMIQIIARNIDLILMNLQTKRFINFDNHDEFRAELNELNNYIKLVEENVRKLQLQNKRRLGRSLLGSRKWQDAS